MKIHRGRYISWLTNEDFMAFAFHYFHPLNRVEDFNSVTIRMTRKDLKFLKRKTRYFNIQKN